LTIDISTIFPSGVSAYEHTSKMLCRAPLVTIKDLSIFVAVVVFLSEDETRMLKLFGWGKSNY
jgi:hypothetical protein